MSTNRRLDADGKLKISGDPVSLRLLAAGDLCPINRLEKPLASGDAGGVFGDCLALFAGADLAVVNLEAPLCRVESPLPKCGPNFGADPAIARTLRSAGVHAACLANNHILDQGPAGLAETLSALDHAGILHLGAGQTGQQAAAPLFLDIHGGRLALLAFAEGEFARSGGGPGAAGLDPAENYRAVSEAAARANWTVVFLHGGTEQVLFPSPLMQKRCREFIQAGAGAVIGHHPHVPQGIEIHNGRPIVYSLGNFLFDWPEHESETDSAFLVELDLGPGGVSELAVHPFRSHRAGGLQLLTDRDRTAYIEWLNQLSEPLDQEAEMDGLWDEQCRWLWENRYRRRLERFSRLDAPGASERRKAVLSFYNLLQCEAHHEGLTRALELLASDQLAPIPALRQRLDDWMTQLKAFALP